eukprot:6378357-Prymnesium_polylepis.1
MRPVTSQSFFADDACALASCAAPAVGSASARVKPGGACAIRIQLANLPRGTRQYELERYSRE